jgi:5,10-methylene-tetrahydrofolate dehydrogenase/methenyl tetrahydrofolate cyclohydrolase
MDEQDTVVVGGVGKFTVESLMETPLRLKHT